MSALESKILGRKLRRQFILDVACGLVGTSLHGYRMATSTVSTSFSSAGSPPLNSTSPST